MTTADVELFAEHQNLHEKLATLLETQILSGKVAAGETLPSERDMAEQYGLSRTVVRDAMRLLVARGLVEVRQGVGAMVTHDQRKSFAQSFNLLLRRGAYSKLDIVEVRRILELEIAALAAERLTPEAEADLAETLRRYREAMNTDDRPAASLAHKQFHASLLQATGNRVLVDFLDPFVAFSVPSQLPLASPAEGMTEDEQRWADFQRHVAIFEAVTARDPEAARAAMREHIRLPEERVRREMAGERHAGETS